MPTSGLPIFINRSGPNYRSRDHLSLVSANARQHRKDLGHNKAQNDSRSSHPTDSIAEQTVNGNSQFRVDGDSTNKQRTSADSKTVLRTIRPKLGRSANAATKVLIPKQRTAKKTSNSQNKDPSLSISPPTYKQDQKNFAECEQQPLPSGPTSSLSLRLHDGLDPFLPLAGANDYSERRYIQHYLAVTAPSIYKGNSRTQTFLDAILFGITTNHIFLHWLLTTSKASHLGLQGLQGSEFQAALSSRRSRGYSLIRQALTDEQKRYDQETLVGLAAASIADLRVSGYQIASKHIIALRRLLYEQECGYQTLDTLPYLSKMILTRAFVSLPQGAAAFPTQDGLDQILNTFYQLMTTLSRWNGSLRRSRHASESSIIEPSDDAEYLGYKAARQRLFEKPNAPLSLLAQNCSQTSPFEERSRMANVICFSLALWHFREDFVQATWFLNSLHRRLGDIAIIGPGELDHIRLYGEVEDALKPFRPGTITSKSETENVSSEAYLDGMCLRSSLLLDVMELLEMVAPHTKAYMMDRLADWVVRDLDDPMHPDDGTLALHLGSLDTSARQMWEIYNTVDSS